MSSDNDASSRFDRRSMLKGIGAASATGLLLGATGSASADVEPEESWYEYDCTDTECTDGSGYVQLRRHCFRDPEAGNVCGSWETYGCC